jgi:hypothetical protein
MIWKQEHRAAFEQANLDAHLHFNFCPICQRWVCDDCISLNDRDGEICEECWNKWEKEKRCLAPFYKRRNEADVSTNRNVCQYGQKLSHFSLS